MPVFQEMNDATEWLKGKSRNIAILFATRAALRVIPFLPRPYEEEKSLRVFRSVQVAWALAAFPGDAALLRAAAEAAALLTAAQDAVKHIGATEASGAEAAAEWACATAAVDGPQAHGFSAHAFEFAFATVLQASPTASDAFLKACGADAEELDQGTSPVTLAHAQLWPGRLPGWVSSAWMLLKETLLASNEEWVVWSDWYEARLKGPGVDNADLEVARASIPNETWLQGPGAVNREIKNLYEERSIWRYALGPNSDWQHRLVALSPEEQTIVGVRAALRAVPLLSFGTASEQGFAAEFLSTMRLLSATHFAGKNPTSSTRRTDAAAAYLTSSKSRVGIIRAISSAAAGPAATSRARGTTTLIIQGIDAIRAAYRQSDGAAAGGAFDLALSQDLDDLRDAPQGGSELPSIELWPGGEAPEWLGRRWNAITKDIIYVGQGWEVWVDWYEARLAGRSLGERELAYVDVPEGLWKEADPARVNTWILRRRDELTNSPNEQARGSSLTTGLVPEQRPAAIEPVWSKGKLSLPKAAAKNNLAGRGLNAALKSLRQELRDFARDLAGEANIDRRFLSYVQQIAEQVPQRTPSQAVLFQLGHAGEVLTAYSATVDAEWPQILASRFHAIVLHYERTMRQSPVWREFKRNAARESLTTQQVEAAASLAAAAASALRDNEASTFADPAIPLALEDLAVALRGSNDLPAAIADAGKEELALDVVESVNNVLKRVGEEALAQAGGAVRDGGSALSKASVEYTRGVAKGIVKAAKRQGPKDGEALFKWLRRAVIAGGTASGSMFGLPHLVSSFPQAFTWLEKLVGFIP
jgi:hypothetical protein